MRVPSSPHTLLAHRPIVKYARPAFSQCSANVLHTIAMVDWHKVQTNGYKRLHVSHATVYC